VPVTDEDVRSLMKHTALPADKIVQFVGSSRIQATRGSIIWVRFGPAEADKKAMCLREIDDTCFLLRANRCIAYESRPAVCREHPFVLRMDKTGRKILSVELNKAAECGHSWRGHLSKRELKKIHFLNLDRDTRYWARVNRWNRRKKHGSEKEFLEFLGLMDPV